MAGAAFNSFSANLIQNSIGKDQAWGEGPPWGEGAGIGAGAGA